MSELLTDRGPRPAPTSVLVVCAHPDDVDFGAAGTVATLTDAGVEVTYCLVTSGDAGGSDRTISRADMAALRQEEQTAAAKHVGVTDLVWLGVPDGRVVADLDLRLAITRVIRQVRPQLVITQSPERVLERIIGSHPDHLATGEATLAAVYPAARDRLNFPELIDEGLEPWKVRQVLVSGVENPNLFLDVSATFDIGLEALFCHASQISDRAEVEEGARERAVERGQMAGMAMASAFLSIIID